MTRASSTLLLVACLTRLAGGQGTPPDSAGGRVTAGIVGRARIDPTRDIAFQAMVLPETVYVGQQATYQVGVFLADEIRARLRRNPQFVPPEVRSVLAFDLPSPATSMTRVVGTRTYDVHIFQRALFPLTAGRQDIPPARLDYALPLSNSFFAREESHTERTSVLRMVARDPPATGRPPDYRGAVGRLSVSSKLDVRRARVGDPLTFTVSVNGIGNVTLLPRPDLRLDWADVVTSDERVTLDSTAVLLRGHKDFDWIVTPRQAGSFSLPAVRYPYFNPYTERYEIALTPAESLRIAPGGTVLREPAVIDSAPSLPIRRLYGGEEPPPLSSLPSFWLLIALTPVPALLLASVRRPARPKAPAHARTLRVLASSGTVDPAALRRAYAAAIAERVLATPAAMSHHSELVRTLRRAGVSPETARDADALLSELDAVVFGGTGKLAPKAARRAYEIVRAIDVEAKMRSDISARSIRIGLVFLLTVGVGLAAQERDADATRAFGQAVEAYDNHDFDAARASFFELAKGRPRAADAWLNFGTTSWHAHDTAAAVVGWQRAVRLQPMAADVRQRLLLAPGYRDGLFGDIPPVSLTLFAVVGAAAWLVGWGIVTWRVGRRRPRPVRGGAPAMIVAVLAGLGGLAQRDLLDPRHAAVVVSRARLRAAPTLAEDVGADAITGEVARIVTRQGAWAKLHLSDGRQGWIEAQRLHFLDVE